MSAKVICFGSAKGGSGKTVTTTCIGVFLAALGKRVLLVDTDAATNGLTLLHLQEVLAHGARVTAAGKEPAGVYDSTELASSGIQVVPLNNGVHLLPATYHFIDTESQPLDRYKSSLRLVLGNFRPKYDYILLDAQAGSDVFAQFAMSRVVSDLVVLVSEYDPMSAAGIERLKGLMSQELTYIRTWILLNKMLPEFAENFGEFLEVARYLNPIPWDADVVRAYARRRLPLDLENGNTYTLAIMQTTRSLLGDEVAEAISQWTESRAEAIRRPIELQYQDLEQELGSIMLNSAALDRMPDKEARLLWTTVFFAVLGVLTQFIFVPSGTKVSELVSNPVYAVPLIFLLIAIGIMGYLVARTIGSGIRRPLAGELEKAKLERRRVVIEEQLRELEVLRVADPESLLQHSKRRQFGSTRKRRS